MLNYDICYFDCLPSTNAYLKERAQRVAEGYVVWASLQSQGKGRFGHSFYSPDGGLYFSVLLRPKVEQCLKLTPLAAVAVTMALQDLGFDKVQIKWVNDIFLNGKKVCGILTEGGFDDNGSYYAIVGIGINLSKPKDGFPSDIENTADSLYPYGVFEQTKKELLNSILKNLDILYEKIDSNAHLEYYREKSYLTGKEIVFEDGKIAHTGVVLGISDDFELLVQTSNNQITKLNSGEVNVKITCKK